MGLGDDVMATGFAYELHRKTGKPVVIGRSPECPAKSVIYENIPWLSSRPNPEAAFYQSAEGRRPYLEYGGKRGRGQRFKEDYRPKPGKLYFTVEEYARAGDLMGVGSHPIIVEPHVKGTFSGQNKAWPWEYWEELVGMLLDAGKEVVQLSKPKARRLSRVRAVSSQSVRVALCCIQWAEALVTTDGLQHHAAGAQGVRAVVLWGARVNPLILGYPSHVNLTSGEDWCGSRSRCGHCEEAMRRITPADALGAVLDAA